METKMTDYTDLVHILRQLNLKYADMAADALEDRAKRIAELEKELDKHRQALVFIQMKAQDTVRPIPFQEEDDE
jgi:hypothetical protein